MKPGEWIILAITIIAIALLFFFLISKILQQKRTIARIKYEHVCQLLHFDASPRRVSYEQIADFWLRYKKENPNQYEFVDRAISLFITQINACATFDALFTFLQSYDAFVGNKRNSVEDVAMVKKIHSAAVEQAKGRIGNLCRKRAHELFTMKSSNPEKRALLDRFKNDMGFVTEHTNQSLTYESVMQGERISLQLGKQNKKTVPPPAE